MHLSVSVVAPLTLLHDGRPRSSTGSITSTVQIIRERKYDKHLQRLIKWPLKQACRCQRCPCCGYSENELRTETREGDILPALLSRGHCRYFQLVTVWTSALPSPYRMSGVLLLPLHWRGYLHHQRMLINKARFGNLKQFCVIAIYNCIIVTNICQV